MITFKKSYAEQLLQLALTLSLLQVDPENYLGHGWDSQLALRNGDGWQLEMLRAAPISEYPYANRKAMMPLIEDLVRFDSRQPNIHNVTAYLLNVQNGQSNQTVGSQDHDSSGPGAVAVETPPVAANSNNSNIMGPDLELFLNSEHFQDSIPIFEQNLADLSEYGDIPLSNFPYFGLPLKDELPELNLPFIDIKLEDEPGTSAIIGNDLDLQTSTSPSPNPSRPNETVGVSWDLIFSSVKEEPEDENHLDKVDKEDPIMVKQEPTDTEVTTETSAAAKEISLDDKNVFNDEESEIVEVLWKQDVDLGYSLSPPRIVTNDNNTPAQGSEDEVEKLKALEELKEDKLEDEIPKDDLEDEWAGVRFTIDNETGEYIQLPLQLDEILQDVLQLTELTDDQEPEIEKDESTVKEQKEDSTPTLADGCSATLEPPQSEVEISSLFDLDDATELDELDMMIQSAGPFQHHRTGQNYGSNSAFRQSGFHHHHHHHHQARVPLSRGVSMEQRLQDIASLFNPIPGMGVGMGVSEMSPYSHYPSHYPYQGAPGIPQHGQFPHPPHPVLHNASLADLGASQPHYGHNLGSAVSSSMHLTNSSHDADSAASGYKMEHEMMYYSNTSSELNHTTDGFINSILNDEDLQLMDMGVNEGFCTMRMLDSNATSNNSSVLGSASSGSHGSHLLPMPTALGGTLGSDGMGSTGDRLDASSDSAVSSMGSERVPSLSDGEWGDAGSDSAQDYHQGKYGGPYDYSYNSRLADTTRQPVAQKKHQMFGKRYFQEQPNIPTLPQPANANQPNEHLPTPVKYEYEPYGGLHHGSTLPHNLDGAVGPAVSKDHLMTHPEMKYACSLDFARQPRTGHDLINHNHTYTLPQGSGSLPRPQLRDKKLKKQDDEHLTRDEKRARSLNIPISVQDIINLPMDEFNERLSKYDLTENQLSLIRDIRRRGKNKVAAQNCRKRKLDQILSLEDEVREVRRRKDSLFHEREVVLSERKRMANKFAALHRHIFQYLRDPEGNPCSPSEYSLQQAADGSVYLLRRDNSKADSSGGNNSSNHSNHSGSGSNPHHHHHPSQGPSSSSHHQKE